ncbi:unnamed protein product [Blepharisma stoltei]|uniref:Glutathione S-transferase n=1 Tax=Blepharisma stoltei TaxID=1481888 RepID=A0AAU9IKT4_9CILI|nr:unnamed protein product [Blepharisma stoltei]
MAITPEKLQLFVHYLCPYAQRALYTLAYKGIQCEIIEVDLTKKPSWFLEVNPLGQVPAARVIQSGKEYHICESINVSEYFDSFPGPPLYPRLPNGTVNPIEKTLVDLNIRQVSDAATQNLATYYKGFGTPEQILVTRKLLKNLDKILENRGFLMTKILGKNELTLSDIVLLPMVERLHALKDGAWRELVDGEDLSNLWFWFENLIEQPWGQAMRADPRRIAKWIIGRRSPEYKGLSLPLTNYD